MILSDISVKRPVFATVLSLLIIISGVLCFTRLPLREYPDIEAPVVSIDTNYIGASADIVESRVTQPIEDIVSGIEGIKSIDSSSQDGRSSITIEFNLSRDVDAAANDVRDRVSRVLDNLPDEVDPPEISKLDSNTSEVVWLALQSETRSALELTDYADRYILDRLSVVDGVARVRIGGERRYAMRIWLDRTALAARGLTVADVENALRRENVELPAGRIESLNRELSVRVDRLYNRAEDFSSLVISKGADGHLVRLSDVAKVNIGAENERTELRSNGKAAIGLGIAKQSKANTLSVAEGAKKAMEEIKKTLPPDIEMMVAFDSSIFIDRSIHEVYFTLGLTLVLVVVVIWAFLGDWRATLIPAVTIPVSLLGAFIFLYGLGFSINLLTLLALVLAIGLVVDDSIVVLENIYKRIEEHHPPLASSYLGVNQVAFAVIATTLVLVAVFVPVTTMEGDIGKLFTEFAWTIVGSVIVSAFAALSLSPMMCSKLLRESPPGHRKNIITRFVNGVLERAEDPYRRGIGFCTRRPLVVVLGGLLLLGAGAFFYNGVPSEYAPTEDRGYFFSMIIAPEGASLEYTKGQMLKAEQQMLHLLSPDAGGTQDGTGEAARVVTIIPAGFSSTGAVNSGFAIALLKPWEQRQRHAGAIVGEMFGRYMSIPGILAFPIMPPSLGQNPRNTPVQFVIGGTNYQELAHWRDLLLEKARENPNLVNLDWDYKEGKPQLRVSIDRDRAGDLGVSVQEIGETLQTFFGSRNVTTYIDRGEEYEVILQGTDADRLSPTDMREIYVRSSRTGDLVPLSNLVTLKEVADAGKLNRYNRLRAITISANLAPGYTIGQALDYLEKAAQEVLPSEARIDYKGQSEKYKEAGGAIYFTFLLALIAVYLFLAAQFESFVHPFVIMTTVPLAVVGALWGLYLTGQTLNIYTQVGLIMLVGLASKNGILIVEFTNQLRDQGVEFYEALTQACLQRLRPILMTSFATAAGAVPLILASGAGAESRIPIGVVVFSGVLFATFLTLFVVPAFYALMARHTGSPHDVARRLDAELEREERGSGHGHRAGEGPL